MKWDKNVEEGEFIECIEGKRTYGYTYIKNKKHATIKSRDFYDKGFNFYHNGKYYRYSTAVAGSEDLKPVPADTFRGETIYNFGIMERDPEDNNKIKFSVVTQADFKINVPAFMLTTFLPKATKTWFDTVQKHYQKNHKNL